MCLLSTPRLKLEKSKLRRLQKSEAFQEFLPTPPKDQKNFSTIYSYKPHVWLLNAENRISVASCIAELFDFS
jgi:hypothetical protein